MDITRRSLLTSAAAFAAAPRVFSANDRIQVGLIACGARAHETGDRAAKNPGVEVTALVDAYKGRLERMQDRLGGPRKIHKDYRELLADKSIDAVMISSPDHWHKRMVVDALRAGKHVYCEKPMTFTSSEGVEIIEVAKQTGRVLQVGSQGVSSDLNAKAREAVQSGKLGKVTVVRATYNRNTASGAWVYPIPPDASPATVDWNMFLGPAPKRPFDLERFFRWRCYQDYSGGIATDLFVHLCTTIHYVMAAKVPSRVVSLGEIYIRKDGRDVPDTLSAVLEYPEGFVVTISSTFNGQGGSEAGFQFVGTEGSISIGNNDITFFPDKSRENNSWIVDSWPKALEDAYYKDPKIIAAELGDNPRAGLKTEKIDVAREDATVRHVANWIAAIRDKKPVYEDAVVGHHAAACAHMVNKAAYEERTVRWDFNRDDIQKT